MANVGIDIAQYVASQVGALTYLTNIFDGPVRPVGNGIPDEAVFCLATGGQEPQAYNDGGSGHNLRVPTVQIMVRSKSGSDNFTSGQTLSDSVQDAVEKAYPTDTIGTEVQQSSPNYLGQDKKGHHEWSINVRVYKRSDA